MTGVTAPAGTSAGGPALPGAYKSPMGEAQGGVGPSAPPTRH